jgi:hypothetical protein
MFMKQIKIEEDGQERTIKIPDYKTEESSRTIDRMSTFFNPSDSQFLRMDDLKNGITHLAHAIDSHCPGSREKSLALTRLEECKMWAIRAIAQGEEPDLTDG